MLEKSLKKWIKLRRIKEKGKSIYFFKGKNSWKNHIISCEQDLVNFLAICNIYKDIYGENIYKNRYREYNLNKIIIIFHN